jgi:hypothetical protein
MERRLICALGTESSDFLGRYRALASAGVMGRRKKLIEMENIFLIQKIETAFRVPSMHRFFLGCFSGPSILLLPFTLL